MTVRLLMFVQLLLVACGDGNSPDASDAPIDPCLSIGGSACFTPLPSAALATANAGAPDLSCTPAPVTMSSVDVQMSGKTLDFETGANLPNGTIDVFYDATFATPAATATSNASGAYTIVLPKPVPSVIHVRLRAADYYDVLNIGATIPVDGQQIATSWGFVARASGARAQAAVGETEDPTTSTFAMFADDCRPRRLVHAVGTLSSTPSHGGGAPTFIPGVHTFYDAGNPPLPAPHATQTETDVSGGYVAYHGPQAGTAYLQMWGFVDQASVAQGFSGLRLISELAVPAIPDTIVVVTTRPTEGPL